MGLVGIFSPNFFKPRDEVWSTNEKVTARILMHPNCSYTVSWCKSISQVVLFGLIHQLPLLRVEFRIPKLTFHSDLRRRAASRRALPCPSSYKYFLENRYRWRLSSTGPQIGNGIWWIKCYRDQWRHVTLRDEVVTLMCLVSSISKADGDTNSVTTYNGAHFIQNNYGDGIKETPCHCIR